MSRVESIVMHSESVVRSVLICLSRVLCFMTLSKLIIISALNVVSNVLPIMMYLEVILSCF